MMFSLVRFSRLLSRSLSGRCSLEASNVNEEEDRSHDCSGHGSDVSPYLRLVGALADV